MSFCYPVETRVHGFPPPALSAAVRADHHATAKVAAAGSLLANRRVAAAGIPVLPRRAAGVRRARGACGRTSSGGAARQHVASCRRARAWQPLSVGAARADDAGAGAAAERAARHGLDPERREGRAAQGVSRQLAGSCHALTTRLPRTHPVLTLHLLCVYTRPVLLLYPCWPSARSSRTRAR